MWGSSAANRTSFLWPAWVGGDQLELPFCTLDEKCKDIFGFKHNDIVRFTLGAWAGHRAIVLGEHTGCLWVQFKDERPVRDLKYCFSEKQLQETHGLTLIMPTDRDAQSMFSPTGADRAMSSPFGGAPGSALAAPPPAFTPAQDEGQLRKFPYAGIHGEYDFACTAEHTAPFGYAHGQVVCATTGADAGKHAVIIGVYNGNLWAHWYGEAAATQLRYCSNKQELDAKYAFREISAAPPLGASKDWQEEEEPGSPISSVRGGWSIEYPGPFGQLRTFDKTPDKLKLFGVRHGQKVRITKGMNRGKEAVIIGISSGVLWMHVEGDKAASACAFCQNEADVRDRYRWADLGNVTLEPGEPFYSYEAGSVVREREVAEIGAVELDDVWDEDHQPQTYRFLRAYARWRLPKSTPKGQSFMLYYVSNTAQRTAEALENLGVVRKFWALQRRREVPEYRKNFADSTEKEMFHALQQVPLQALTICATMLDQPPEFDTSGMKGYASWAGPGMSAWQANSPTIRSLPSEAPRR